MTSMFAKVRLALATGFGLGYAPVASGTAGTLPGVVLVLLLWHLPWPVRVGIALALPLLAVPICGWAEGVLGRKDDGRIVADEYMTFPLCMLGLPMEPWTLALAFLTHRAFDVLKPFPARGLQRLHGGTGIVIDDVIASVYSLATNHALVWMAGAFLK